MRAWCSACCSHTASLLRWSRHTSCDQLQELLISWYIWDCASQIMTMYPNWHHNASTLELRACACDCCCCCWPYFVICTALAVIFYFTKKNALMIGHCTALAVIVTKTLAGKIFEPKQDKDGKLTTPHVWLSRVKYLVRVVFWWFELEVRLCPMGDEVLAMRSLELWMFFLT